jgi:competence protein ComEC
MFNHPQPPLWLVGLTLVGIIVLLAPRGLPARWLGLLMLLPLGFSKSDAPANGELRLTLLDVGQGLAVVIETAQHCVVYDTGGKFSSEHDSGSSTLVPFLQAQGIARVDMLMISHGDNDHIGGAASLLQAMPTERLLSSAPNASELAAYGAKHCYAGQSWHYDGVSFQVLSPIAGSAASDNNQSCVLRVQTSHTSLLLTGDIETASENALVARYAQSLHSEVLLSPHHGSKTSSSWAFLQAVKPSMVLISAGYRNSFGHPHAQVLNRYKAINATWFNTANTGAITIETNTMTLHTMRQTRARYWHNN